MRTFGVENSAMRQSQVTQLDQPRPQFGLVPWLAFFFRARVRFWEVRFDIGELPYNTAYPACAGPPAADR